MSARFEIVHGNPSAEELAAVVSLLTAAAAAAPAPPAPAVASAWGRPVLRSTPLTGHGAWIRSGLPQP